MKFFTSVYFLVFLCLIAAILTAMIIRRTVQILAINKLRKENSRGPEHIADLLAERFPNAEVYCHHYFLKNAAKDDGLKTACDVVYVSKGGVLLLTVLSKTGVYDNPKIGNWRHRYINTNKETVTVNLTNPFDEMAFFANVTEKLLLSEEVLNPAVSRAVVFSADLVNFTNDYDECLTVATLFDYVERFNARKHFTDKEFHRACEGVVACNEYLRARLQKIHTAL